MLVWSGRKGGGCILSPWSLICLGTFTYWEYILVHQDQVTLVTLCHICLLFVCGGRHMPSACVESDNLESQFSPSTLWVLGLKLRASGLGARAFSHQALLLHPPLFIYHLVFSEIL